MNTPFRRPFDNDCSILSFNYQAGEECDKADNSKPPFSDLNHVCTSMKHKRHKTPTGFVPFVNLKKSELVNTKSGNRILVSVRHPDALSIKHDGLGLKAHRNRIEK